ncbi:calcium-binding protein [Celeribacter neptunius]|uniref:Hemolysin-type calcium-binding repeat-containing protein n=1 Tax=Celeribacter neptunius TaxID=588602 RepID=A0A1I3JS97_9RHOB|nr:calcium-binding protein [Celeribacter neptunius]SFI63073.1 hypothetical protein SAMN04487991_0447 [Celeribacter neptunius]
MFGLILLGLVAPTLVGLAIYDAFDDDDSTHDEERSEQAGQAAEAEPGSDALADAPVPDDADPAEIATAEGETLLFDGSEVLTGSEGDDSLAAGQEGALAPSEIHLLGGDDEAELDLPYDITLYGGAGNDTLTGTIGNTLDGGEGDDTLVGIDATNLYGGAGNDDITWNSDTELNDMTARIDGGAGDDRIEIRAEAGTDQPDRGGASVTGGEGSDDFEVVLELQNSELALEADDHLESRIATIGDFDPAQDRLSIEIERGPGTEDRDTSVEMAQEETEAGGYVTTLTLSYAETEEALAATSVLTIYSDTPFGLGDIEFTGLATV